MKKKFGLILLALTFLASCENTIHGFGKDMQKAGEKIQTS